MSIESVIASSHLIHCLPLPALPSVFPNSRVFSSESHFCIMWPNFWSFRSVTVLPVNIQDWFSLELTGLISLQSKKFSRVFSSTTVQKHQFFSTQPSFWSSSHIHTWLVGKKHSFDYTDLCWQRDMKSRMYFYVLMSLPVFPWFRFKCHLPLPDGHLHWGHHLGPV